MGNNHQQRVAMESGEPDVGLKYKPYKENFKYRCVALAEIVYLCIFIFPLKILHALNKSS